MNENNIGMSVMEYLEKRHGSRIYSCQKDFIKLFNELPKGCRVIMGQCGPIIIDKRGEIYCGHI